MRRSLLDNDTLGIPINWLLSRKTSVLELGRMAYTTQELMPILDRERQGDRILLSAKDRLQDPVLIAVLG